ncbi:gamma-glutamyltranspeptidase/glutathione hydrolase [Archangium gephyra]|uniref:Glutathione hydrolase proenzyme n=1 Tax=Archangium gephyra TaxID=48 RepID=A0AAC8Q0L1_9BACT|nr:gamma-glutamyltransferase [Archangium gephyra]AKI98777.1 Gamma-glutamyltranspeptidase [Archangium gephyra]REG30697.1 gamma-glutamyltranspeptidase/glutathione hydrolase [Archangium gephyra]
MRRLLFSVSASLVCLGLVPGCTTLPAPRPEPRTLPASTATGRGGAAATVDVRATSAALEVLRSGGNAIDAAVAAASVLGVTDPYSCGIGGGGFLVAWLARDQRVVTLDHRETAPAGLERSRLYEKGVPLPFEEFVTSGLSVGVPGALMGWSEALRLYGSRPLADVLQPAIRVAEQGFEVDATFHEQTRHNVERFRDFTSSAALFLGPDGQPWPVGATFRNPGLARTYRLVAQGGAPAFYRGELAQAIVSTVTQPPLAPGASRPVRPGVMRLEDLERYEALVRPPVTSTYRGYTLYGMGAPGSGGVTLALTLNLLEAQAPASLSRAEFLHRYLEASRLAFADRNAFLGDPAFVSVPEAGLLSREYAARRGAMLDGARASTSAVAPGNPLPFQGAARAVLPRVPEVARPAAEEQAPNKETTHITTSDAAGNIATYTCTIEGEGGNGMVVPGYGFLLNNELTDFDLPATVDAPHPNAPAPGKRPRSSMSPLLVFKDGAPVLALGSPGGATIITTVGQTLVNHLDFGMPIEQALAAPRVSQRNSPDHRSQAEPAFLASPEAAALGELGHGFTNVGPIGALTAIRFHPDGTVTAAAEPTRRGGGSAMVVEPVK